jgi:hypothetical protein
MKKSDLIYILNNYDLSYKDVNRILNLLITKLKEENYEKR